MISQIPQDDTDEDKSRIKSWNLLSRKQKVSSLQEQLDEMNRKLLHQEEQLKKQEEERIVDQQMADSLKQRLEDMTQVSDQGSHVSNLDDEEDEKPVLDELSQKIQSMEDFRKEISFREEQVRDAERRTMEVLIQHLEGMTNQLSSKEEGTIDEEWWQMKDSRKIAELSRTVDTLETRPVEATNGDEMGNSSHSVEHEKLSALYLESMVATFEAEKQVLTKKISDLESELHDSEQALLMKDSITEELQRTIEKFGNSVEDQQAAHEKKIAEVEECHSRELEETTDEWKTKLEKAQQSLKSQLDAAKSEISGLAQQLEASQKEVQDVTQRLEASQEEITSGAQQLEATQKEMENLTQELEASRQETDNLTQELEAKVNEEVTKSKEIEERLNAAHSVEQQQWSESIETAKQLEAELQGKISVLEDIAESTIEEFEQEVNRLKQAHTQEIDDLLSQLDLVEEEQKQHCQKLERAVVEKDDEVQKLRAKLSEMQTQSSGTEEQQRQEIMLLHEKAQFAFDEAEALRKTLESQKIFYQKAMDAEASKREEACKQAREEMVEQAQVQFEQANELYIQLKHEYNLSVEEIEKLETDLREADSAAERTKQKFMEQENEWNTRVAEMKATQAQSDAEYATKINNYVTELELSSGREKQVQEQLQKTATQLHAMESNLASLVLQRDQLVAENEDLKAVCEEAMALVEAHDLGQR